MLGIASMLTAGAAVAGATAASAHTPSISATCDGVVVSGSNYENRDANTLTVTLDGVTETKDFKVNGTLKVHVPQDGKTHSWSASVTTTNDNPEYSTTGSGDIGPCGSTPESEKISYCHWAEGGHYNALTTSKFAFYKHGHIDHPDDIYPADSVVHNGETFSWSAQGDQALLVAGCGTTSPATDATASATALDDETCDSAGTVRFDIENATWKDETDTTDGSRVAVADKGHLFANGKKKMTVTYTAHPQKSGAECTTPPSTPRDAVASASTTPGTCLAQGGVTFAIEHATWDDIADTSDGSRTATATAGHLFADGSTSATVTYTIPRQTPWTDAACQPTFEVTQVCGNVTITYHNTSKWDRWPDYRIEGDGVPSKDAGSGPYYTAVKVPAGQTAVILDHDFVEDYNGGSATVTYQDILGAERDIDTAAQTVTVDTDCAPPVTNQVCVAPAAGDTSTNLHPTWTASDTRSAGHYEYVDGGLHIWTTDATSNAKVAMRHAASFPLKNTGTIGIDYSATTGTSPGVQLYVNFDGTNTGTLVYEPVYGQDLWLTGGSSDTVKNNAPVNGGGNGSTWHGTIDQWLTKFPDAQVVGIGFSLGSGVLGDGVLHSITAGCTQYFFDYAAAPQTPPVVVVPPVTPPGPPVVVPPVTSIPPQVGGVKVTAPPTAPSTVPVVTPTVEGVKHEAAAALPRTGTEAGWYGAAGILLLMAGSGLVLVSRRRTARH